jgi:phage terminase large subunit
MAGVIVDKDGDIWFNTNGNAKQKQVASLWTDKTTTDIVYGGSKGSGKSFLGASLIFGDAFIYPETSYFIARVSLTNIRKFTIPSIMEVFQIWGITQKYWRYNGQDNFYELHNGSKVFLLDAAPQPRDELYMRFGSMQITRGFIEEAGEFQEAAKNNLAASIGRWKNDTYNLTPKLLQTCNPSKNYLYREYYRKFKEDKLEDWKAFVQALPQDNKKLPDGYLENLNRMLSRSQKRRLLDGDWEFDDSADILIEYEKSLDCFTNYHVPSGKNYITSDLARLGGDKIVKVEWDGFRGKVSWWSRVLLPVTGKRLEEARLRMGIGKSDVLCDEDGVGGGVVDYEKFKGFVNNSSPLPSPDAPLDDKGKPIKENFDNLKSQCSFRMADRINKNGLYLECDEEIRGLIIEEMEQVRAKNLDSDMKKGVIPKDKIKEILGRSPDFWDAIMMREYFELKPIFVYRDASYD